MRRVFRNYELEAHFVNNGYCLVKLFSEDDLNQLENIYYNNRVDVPAGMERSTNSKDIDLSRRIKDLSGAVVSKKLEEYLVDYKMLYSGFITKIPGKTNTMKLHQDPSFVDENNFCPLNVWAPLTDVDESNGALWIVKQSHKFFKGYRGQPAKAFSFDDIAGQVMSNLGTMMPMKAGEALIYNTALFHFSLENTSGKARIANSSVVIPKEAAPIYYYHNKATNTLDIYEMGEDFLIRHYSEYMKTGVVQAKLLSREEYTPAQNVSYAEFEDKYFTYNPVP